MQLVDCDSYFTRLTSDPKLGIISAATLELTTHCNLKCSHCYCQGTHYRELTLEQWKSIADKLFNAGCLTIVLTGGEPLLRPDFSHLYQYLKSKGFLIYVLTNATLLSEDLISLFREFPPIVLDISLYGSRPDVYDRVTQSRGISPLLMGKLERLRAEKIPFALKTMVLNENLGDIEDIAGIAKKFGVDFRLDPVLHPRRNGDTSCCLQMVSPQNAAEKEFLQPDRREAISRFFSARRSLRRKESPKGLRFLCQVENRTNVIFVRADGAIAPCSGLGWCARALQASESMSENIRLFWADFNENWTSHPRMKLCQKCGYRGLCSFCPAAEMASKSLRSDCQYWYSLNQGRENLERKCNEGNKRQDTPETIFISGHFEI